MLLGLRLAHLLVRFLRWCGPEEEVPNNLSWGMVCIICVWLSCTAVRERLHHDAFRICFTQRSLLDAAMAPQSGLEDASGSVNCPFIGCFRFRIFFRFWLLGFFGFLASWLFGFLAFRLLGFLAFWIFGFLAFRLLGFSASC